MQQLIKRFAAFLHIIPVYVLVFVLFWCNAGSLLWTSVREGCYHYMQAHHANAGARDTIAITEAKLKSGADLLWTKRKECRYKGRMFDVYKQIAVDGKVLLIGRYDKTDDNLLDILVDYFDDRSDKPADDTESSSPQWITEAVITVQEWIRPLFFDKLQAKIIPPELFFSSFKLPVLSEPPDMSTVY